MTKKSITIATVGWLSIVYGLVLAVSVVVFVLSLSRQDLLLNMVPFAKDFESMAAFQRYAVVLWILLLPQFIGLLAALKLKEWGRNLTVVTSVLMCAYFFYLIAFEIKKADVHSVSTIFVYLAVIVFLNLPRVKSLFQGKGSYKKILVVDDDKGVLKVMKASLGNFGFEVLTAETGEAGLAVARARKPDLIILYVIIPGIKGREVCARLKQDEATKHIPVVFLTAKNSPDDIQAELEAGAVAHLTKPLDPQAVLAEVQKALHL